MADLSVAEEMMRRADPAALLGTLAPLAVGEVAHDWRVWRRPKQATPAGDWSIWLILAGRGFGKTRTGAEWVREQVNLGNAAHIALVGPTAADVRDTMIEGESGILSVFPPGERPHYEPSKRRVTFHNGAAATAYTADEPDRLRGPNHDLAWCDELAAWRYPDAWDMLILGLRIGRHPRALVTTTPRPTRIIRNLVERSDVHVTRGSTYENRGNLAPSFFAEIIARYEGTRLGRQELHAEILDDVDGALWNRDLIEAARVTSLPNMTRIVIAIDPAVSSKETSAETGIVACGLGEDGHGYVLEDRSTRGTPNQWASEAVASYHRLKADRIVAEANQGGDMIRHTLDTVERNIPIRLVHASRGKRVRAEPIVALYEQGRVHHVGMFADLEDQLCSWVPDISASPDRLDALVWGLTELIVDGARRAQTITPVSMEQSNPWIPR
jgi:phage terminase large subunit-like protein